MDTPVEAVDGPQRPRFYRVDLPWQRIASYLMVGGSAVLSMALVLQQLEVKPLQECLLLLPFAFSMIGGAFLIFWQLLRVDAHGISRRWLVGWDPWPWEAFRNQQVDQGFFPHSFTYQAKPWWNRYLTLEFLSSQHRHQVEGFIKRHWRLPDLPALPEELRLRYGLFQWVRLTREGIMLGRVWQKVGKYYPWSDVRQARLNRADHSRRDLLSISMDINQQAKPIVISNLSFRGHNSKVVSALMEQVIPKERLLLVALNGRPQSLAEANRRIAELDRRYRELELFQWYFLLVLGILGTAFVIFLIIFAINDFRGIDLPLFGLLYVGSMALIVGPPASGPLKIFQIQRSELVTWSESLKTIANEDSVPPI